MLIILLIIDFLVTLCAGEAGRPLCHSWWSSSVRVGPRLVRAGRWGDSCCSCSCSCSYSCSYCPCHSCPQVPTLQQKREREEASSKSQEKPGETVTYKREWGSNDLPPMVEEAKEEL